MLEQVPFWDFPEHNVQISHNNIETMQQLITQDNSSHHLTLGWETERTYSIDPEARSALTSGI